mmetsp:Transcript_333/g.734  ORF Transcript_333/g.734 Transcript_333/m.734 type:complete len:94 (+) Transcript_333:679-960(+)
MGGSNVGGGCGGGASTSGRCGTVGSIPQRRSRACAHGDDGVIVGPCCDGTAQETGRGDRGAMSTQQLPEIAASLPDGNKKEKKMRKVTLRLSF